ncbi:hypothetical protein QBC44DRAFT_232780, partial [Cladorrhinum sp. PSN332]
LFPFPDIRQRYREQLLGFRLNTLPIYKQRLQSRIYRFILERQRKRLERTRLVDLVRHQLLGGPPPKRTAQSERLTDAIAKEKKMSSRNGYDSSNSYTSNYGSYGYGGGNDPSQQPREPGARRKKLAAFAGSVYRAGAAAATEIKEQYNNTRLRNLEPWDATQYSIPGAFPNVKIITKGEEQMVLFPTYAKTHVKGVGKYPPGHIIPPVQTRDQNTDGTAQNEEQYWKSEWDRAEDEKAIVDVDIRGWIYMPSKGPMTRRNRMVIGIARRLSGIPPPTTSAPGAGTSNMEERERQREEERIAKEAKEIERRGKGEEEVANRGGYSEGPEREFGGISRANSSYEPTPPPSPPLSARTHTGLPADLTETELAVANANLMARIGPFMTTPMVEHPITIFFYNDVQSRSVTITTDDSGHFSTRAFLDFVPTNVRILANENISATNPIEIIESRGVSLISDVDDTIKRSNIGMGAREIFRNTFIRDLSDLTVPGVTDWYNSMHSLGVKMHYCSNSPWQLFPVLATFFHASGLPHGSIHLKHYSGMLQGIFEPVAERKKGTLEAILRDFPERKFMLVGDSGEADLEVYTELAVQNPGRILAVFIRDVTTPEQPGFFDSSFIAGEQQQQRSRQAAPQPSRPKTAEPGRPQLPPRSSDTPSSTRPVGPTMGTLIDFSDEPEQISPSLSSQHQAPNPSSDAGSRKAVPPPRPAKPAALRSATSDGAITSRPPPVTTPRGHARSSPPPPPPPPRRRGTPLANTTGNKDIPDLEGLSLSPRHGGGSSSPSTSGSGGGNRTPNGSSNNGGGGGAGQQQQQMTAAQAAINKKVDLWLRRLTRAHEVLDGLGVQLYTWRKGDDVIKEAEGIVKGELRRQEREHHGHGYGGGGGGLR